MTRCDDCNACGFEKTVKFYCDVCKYLCDDCRKKRREQKKNEKT